MVLYLSKIKKKEPLSTAQRKQNEIEKPKKRESFVNLLVKATWKNETKAIERKRRKSKTAGKSRS